MLSSMDEDYSLSCRIEQFPKVDGSNARWENSVDDVKMFVALFLGICLGSEDIGSIAKAISNAFSSVCVDFHRFFLSFLVNWHRLYQAFDGQYRRFRYWKCKDLYSFKVIIFFRSHFFIQIQLNGWRMWISLHSKGISCIKWGVLRRYFKNPGTFFFIVKILPILEVLRIMWENMDSSCFEKKKLHKNLTEMTFEDYNSAVYICFLCFLDFY